MEFESEKVIYLSKKKIMEEFIEEHPGFKGEEENLTISIVRNSYTIKKGKKLLQLIQVNPGYIFKESGRIYGYARISRPKQSIERQIRNIKTEYPDAIILQEAYTGRKINRPEWNRLYENLFLLHYFIVFNNANAHAAKTGVQRACGFKINSNKVHINSHNLSA